MATYHTLSAETEHHKTFRNLVPIALGCAFVGLLMGFAVSPSSSLYLNIGTVQQVKTAAPASIPVQWLARGRADNVVMASHLQRPQAGLNSEDAPALLTPMQAVVGGLAVAVAATIAVAAKLFRSNAAANALAQYQAEEARWAMNAATAFVGTAAPDFKATAVYDEEFVEIELSQYRGQKYVVLFFYPLDFTFVCPTEITAFSDRAGDFEAIDTQIIGVSVDSQFAHLAWVQTPRNEGGLGEITYPLVADLKKEIATSYGVLTDEGVALRGLFIIDKAGVIQHATINNLAFGRSVDETLRILEAIQHVQANPDEVCPAGWKKGDKTMKPDPEGSKEYFKAI